MNVDANLTLMRECYPLLKLAPLGGRVVVIGSKNVAAPGPGAAAYSASKAALTQLARVAALEWGEAGIRVNTLHPNAVFDTGIWTDEVLTGARRELRFVGRRLQTQQRPRDRSAQQRRRRTRGGNVRACLCQDHRRADPDRWRERAGDLMGGLRVALAAKAPVVFSVGARRERVACLFGEEHLFQLGRQPMIDRQMQLLDFRHVVSRDLDGDIRQRRQGATGPAGQHD